MVGKQINIFVLAIVWLIDLASLWSKSNPTTTISILPLFFLWHRTTPYLRLRVCFEQILADLSSKSKNHVKALPPTRYLIVLLSTSLSDIKDLRSLNVILKGTFVAPTYFQMSVAPLESFNAYIASYTPVSVLQ